MKVVWRGMTPSKTNFLFFSKSQDNDLPFGRLNGNWHAWNVTEWHHYASQSSFSHLSVTHQLTEWQSFIPWIIWIRDINKIQVNFELNDYVYSGFKISKQIVLNIFKNFNTWRQLFLKQKIKMLLTSIEIDINVLLIWWRYATTKVNQYWNKESSDKFFFNFRCEKVLMTRPPFCVLYLGQVLHIQNVFKRKQENKITKTLSDTELESRMWTLMCYPVYLVIFCVCIQGSINPPEIKAAQNSVIFF